MDIGKPKWTAITVKNPTDPTDPTDSEIQLNFIGLKSINSFYEAIRRYAPISRDHQTERDLLDLGHPEPIKPICLISLAKGTTMTSGDNFANISNLAKSYYVWIEEGTKAKTTIKIIR